MEFSDTEFNAIPTIYRPPEITKVIRTEGIGLEDDLKETLSRIKQKILAFEEKKGSEADNISIKIGRDGWPEKIGEISFEKSDNGEVWTFQRRQKGASEKVVVVTPDDPSKTVSVQRTFMSFTPRLTFWSRKDIGVMAAKGQIDTTLIRPGPSGSVLTAICELSVQLSENFPDPKPLSNEYNGFLVKYSSGDSFGTAEFPDLEERDKIPDGVFIGREALSPKYVENFAEEIFEANRKK